MKRFLVVGLILGILLLVGGYFGYRGYVSTRQARLVKQARTFLDQSNGRKAQMCLQRALQYNPKDVEACRLMAELSEAGRSPSALLWRRRVVEFNPHSLDDRLALAQTAMLLRDYPTATNALEGVDQAGKKTAGYHNVAGALAAAINQHAQAEAHFLEAARLDPQNPAPQLNLAVVRLHSTNMASQVEARTSLEHLRSSATNSLLRCQVLRELVIDAMHRKQDDVALSLSGELLQQTNSLFSDRLLRLELLRESRKAEFKSELIDAQRMAASDPGRIYELATWQMVKTSPAETLAWLGSLPASTQTNQPTAWMIADCQTVLSEWQALQLSLQKQNWAELDFLRHAYLSRALQGLGVTAASKGEWELAVNTADNQEGSLTMLLRMSARWGRERDAEELLWAIVNHYPGETWAGQALVNAFFANGRTRSLLQLFNLESKRHPSSLAIRNNLAMMALLLEAWEFKPHDLARTVYDAAPTNSSYASTFAFSLYLQKKPAEALKILQQISSDELAAPPMAGYYAMVLKANGNREKAEPYFDLSTKARLLPEERKLIDKAKAAD